MLFVELAHCAEHAFLGALAKCGIVVAFRHRHAYDFGWTKKYIWGLKVCIKKKVNKTNLKLRVFKAQELEKNRFGGPLNKKKTLIIINVTAPNELISKR